MIRAPLKNDSDPYLNNFRYNFRFSYKSKRLSSKINKNDKS